MIATFLALSTALGADAGATKHAYKNLWNYKPEVEKVAKAKKEPAFNERAAIKTALAEGKLDELLKDERISADLNVAIVTYQTLANVEGLPEEVLTAAKSTLESFGSKSKSGRTISGPKEAFHIEVNGVSYTNLTVALRAKGYGDKLVGEKNHREIDVVWRKCRGPLLKDGSVELDGLTYSKVKPSESSIGAKRKVADKTVKTKSVDAVTEDEQTEEYA